ncbi:MAG: redox-sensing transcriptional repressor Rex [Muribaculaceae bacterium]|nr:redox-sensing transcriptional repressor Rex [Muribaculaceae bacterium]
MSENKNMPKPTLPEPTLRRLPWYLAYVRLLEAQHIEYVSSTQISKEINVDASQIAKDLSFLNLKGKTRIGYQVSLLVKKLTDFLGFKSEHKAFVIGVGSLGAALIQDVGLSQYGLKIVGGFDIDMKIVGTSVCDVPIYDMSELEQRQKQQDVSIAILTVPVEHAQEATNQIVSSGLHAIWNFTPFRIKVPEGIVIQNTSIYAHLALIYNRMGEKSGKKIKG